MKNKKVVFSLASAMVLIIIFIIAVLLVINKSSKKEISGCTGGCSGCSGCAFKSQTNSTYYISKEDKLIKSLEDKQKIFSKELELKYSSEEIREITQDTIKEFKLLIPQIPYIGGDSNNMTEDIEQAAMALAFYRVQKERGAAVEEIGNSICNGISKEINSYPKLLLRYSGRKFFSKGYIAGLKSDCAISQEKLYKGAWVTNFIDGDGKSFDFGYNHTECGIVKFFHEQHADELTPYMCKLDYIYSDALDEGLTRTTTLAEGGAFCDFRYKRVENRKLDLIITALFIAIIAILCTVILLIVKLVIKRRHLSLKGTERQEFNRSE